MELHIVAAAAVEEARNKYKVSLEVGTGTQSRGGCVREKQGLS